MIIESVKKGLPDVVYVEGSVDGSALTIHYKDEVDPVLKKSLDKHLPGMVNRAALMNIFN